MKFIDLFAGLGGFHLALKNLGHECVFASEIDKELRGIYAKNFPKKSLIFGDIRKYRDEVPPHDILCAGFPCQPFSKSGTQLGLHDKIRGTLFDEIVHILETHKPQFIILENVGNFERHDKGRTWKIVKENLTNLGYAVKGTEHITSGGTGLISPHYLGYPHSRERFFIVAQLGKLPDEPFPVVNRKCKTNLDTITQTKKELTEEDQIETQLSTQQVDCIDHWNNFIQQLPADEPLPPSPIWGDEINATYPFENHTPYSAPIEILRTSLNGRSNLTNLDRESLLEYLPKYARRQQDKFPEWKIKFIKDTREWFNNNRELVPSTWVQKLHKFPPSLRKLEWNCKGEERDLWNYVLQFRPSGLRVKRYSTSPSLVAMTSTQIPILGPEKRFLTRVEGLRLQGFPDNFHFPSSRDKTFKALGNAVHVKVVETVAEKLLENQ